MVHCLGWCHIMTPVGQVRFRERDWDLEDFPPKFELRLGAGLTPHVVFPAPGLVNHKVEIPNTPMVKVHD